MTDGIRNELVGGFGESGFSHTPTPEDKILEKVVEAITPPSNEEGQISVAMDQLEQAEMLRDFEDKFKENVRSGLIDLELQTKVLYGKKIGGVSFDHTGQGEGSVEHFNDISVINSNFKTIKGDIKYKLSAGMIKLSNIQMSDYDAFVVVSPAIVEESRKIGGALGWWNFLRGKDTETSQRRPALSGDFGDNGSEEKMVNVNIGYHLDLEKYVDQRHNLCKLHVIMPEGLVDIFLSAIRKKPELFEEMIEIMVPGIMDSVPLGKKVDNDNSLGISDHREEMITNNEELLKRVESKSKLESLSWEKNKVF